MSSHVADGLGIEVAHLAVVDETRTVRVLLGLESAFNFFWCILNQDKVWLTL